MTIGFNLSSRLAKVGNAIKSCESILLSSESILQDMVNHIQESNRIHIVAMGKNLPAADAAARTFRSLGFPAISFDAANVPHGDLAVFDKYDHNVTTIAISKSGKTKEIVDLIKHQVVDFLLTSDFKVYDSKEYRPTQTLWFPCSYEGDKYDLIPLTSPVIYLTFLNQLALICAEQKLGEEETVRSFLHYHPAGQLGKVAIDSF